MIISILNYALSAFLLVYGFRVRFRRSDTQNTQLIFYYFFAAAVAAFSLGAGYSAAISRYAGVALFFIRLTASAIVGTHILVFLLALSFPYEKNLSVLRTLGLLLWAGFAIVILFSDLYEVQATYEAGELIHVRGPLFIPVTVGGFSLGIISGIILFVRRLFFRSQIFKLQTLLVIIGLCIGYVINFTLAVLLPVQFGLVWTYPFMMLGGTLLALILGYGVSITRLIDVRAVASSLFSFILYSLVVGGISGILYTIAYLLFHGSSFIILFFVGVVIFLVVDVISRKLRARFKALLQGRGAYAERLEEDLSKLDYSLGRDAVITEFLQRIQKNMGCSSVHLFIENDEEQLVLIRSNSNALQDEKSYIPRKSPGIDHLLNEDVSILIKTEIITNYDYHTVKEELLALLDKYNADALVLLRDGRSVIGALLLGAKSNGAEFLDYDYDALRRIYGKLFVTAYYLKNIAQESLVMTVDRELEYSEQIIQSLQENIDRIEHPHADISFMTRSARKLGGDFIDFIRLTKDRYICVMGDVSGKGLNASMSMVILKSIIRTYLKETKDFKTLIIRVNGFIKEYLPRGTFFAGFIGLFDFNERSLYYINCGIPTMLLLSSSYNNPVEIQGAGKVLGFVKDIAPYINVRKAGFKAGDILLVTTDGLIDAESVRGVRFGKERLQASLLENRSLSAERIVRFLNEDVIEFISQEINDDITILAIKFM
ncbi:SpoIIE family protein phosphatase [Gracilinema caldarium]|uniref:Protein serine/threonine phosphatase n=1 Tax=Gracilinema caldarium (strain ATCC 51460 / DSM 7334 / H1) TaxID=744872 RepID=F8F141_GRAC1|nr:SpoIIE family protein phosphatase [Gracilinema caldarium]AEJ20831.1 protein serine/threonine phosphatase [Gracilinema caldarium DSM 7334]